MDVYTLQHSSFVLSLGVMISLFAKASEFACDIIKCTEKLVVHA
jgi:hypothetical protein